MRTLFAALLVAALFPATADAMTTASAGPATDVPYNTAAVVAFQTDQPSVTIRETPMWVADVACQRVFVKRGTYGLRCPGPTVRYAGPGRSVWP